MGEAIIGILMYYFFKYGYTNPDEAGCWVGDIPETGTRVVWADERNPMTGVTLINAVDVGAKF